MSADGFAGSTFDDEPSASHDDTAIVEAIAAICDEFEAYGWRRVRAELRHRGMIVNHKKIRRLMREQTFSLAGTGAMWPPPTAIMTSRSIPIEPKI
jgi:hypothetical protein